MSWHTILADHIDRWEGLRLKAYRDQGGVWTIGWGHTGDDVHEGMTITRAEAEALLAHDIGWAARAVDNTVTVPINDKMKAALASMIFNIGAGGWRSSTALRRLNAGDYEGCAEAMTRWNKVTVNGRKITSAGLVNRREHERALFMEGYRGLAGVSRVGAPMPPSRPGGAKGGEAKKLTESKTAIASAAGAATAGAPLVSSLSYLDWRVAVPLILIVAVFGFLFVNRWLEAKKGEH